MASAAAAAPVSGQVVQRFRARLREEAGEEPGAAAVVGVYEEALAELTFNCKPIITELTIIAEQHAALAARGIADVICARIVEVPVEQKLPSLYLLDSIVKNIGREYVPHFSTRLQKIFCYAYRKVHPNQHASMQHLFRTWSQVFPSAVLRGIEDELQFSPSEIKRPASTNNVRQSESLSPSPSHGIHVNPKYLDAQHQFKHVSKVDQLVTHDRQMTDVEDDHINGLTSNGLRGFPATSSKLQETFQSRAGMTRRDMSRSPPLDVLPRNASPKRPPERPPLSHSLLGHDPRRLPDRNGWFERQWAFEDGPQRPSMSMLDEEYRKRSARELIDAYGGNDAEERLPKIPRLEPNGMSSRSSAQNWLTSEEDEYSWDDMSPTLSIRNRNDMLLPSSETLRAGFPGPNSGQLDSDIGMRSWHSQAPRSAADRPALILDDRISANSHVDMATRRHTGNFGPQNGATSDYHSSENSLDLGRMLAMSAPPWQQTNGLPLRVQDHQPSLNRLPLPTDGEMPVKRLATGGTYDAMNVDIPLIDNQRSSPAPGPIEWPPLHHSQPPPDRKHIRRSTDNLEIRSFIGQGINSSVFVPRHHYDALDRKNGSTGNLAQPPYQHPDMLSLSQQNQGTILDNQSQPPHTLPFHPHTHSRPQEPFRGFATSISVDPSRNPFQGQGGSATMPPVPPLRNSFSVPPSVQPYGTSVPNFALPPLHRGLPSASLPMGPSSSQVGGPTPFFSGILSNLMHQGVITLEPPSQPQESVGVDFNVDLKVRNESVINALYQDLPRQCKTCGLRFKCQEEHRVHMDWHVTKNRNSKNRKQSSRKYFVTVGEWLRAAETVGNDAVPSFEHMEPVPDRNEEKEMAVPADEDQTTCALCQEPFEDFYSDETEEWMYKGAVYMNAPDGNIIGLERSHLGPIVHAKCRSGPSYT